MYTDFAHDKLLFCDKDIQQSKYIPLQVKESIN